MNRTSGFLFALLLANTLVLYASDAGCANQAHAEQAFPEVTIHEKLHEAIEVGDPRAVATLLNDGASQFVEDKNGDLPLDKAILLRKNDERYARIVIVHMLLADTNTGRTPLIHALCADDFKHVLHMLYQGANVESPDTCGRTPLYYVVMLNNYTLAQLLLSWGARPDAPSRNWDNTFDETPYLYAERILSANSPVRKIIAYVHQLYAQKCPQLEGNKTTVLHSWALTGARDKELCNHLLNTLFIPVDHSDTFGQTPLFCATHRYMQKDQGEEERLRAFARIKILLACGANPHQVTKSNWSPYRFAASHGNRRLLTLFGYYADPDAYTLAWVACTGKFALLCAINRNNQPCAQLSVQEQTEAYHRHLLRRIQEPSMRPVVEAWEHDRLIEANSL